MRQSKAVIAVVAVLMAAMSIAVFARNHPGGGGRGGHAHSGKASPGSHGGHAVAGRASPGSHGGHAFSGRAGRGSHGGHGVSGARAPAVHVAPQRHFAGGARVGVFIAAPVYAPLFYPAPSFTYLPPPVYIEQAPTTAYWYFCPESNAYYPYVRECPGGWQPVLPQPSG